VTPIYQEFAPWNQEAIRKATSIETVPLEARLYLDFLEASIGQKIVMMTTGPERGQFLKC